MLTPDEIEKAFDLDEQFRNVDAIFDRVFASVPAAALAPRRRDRAGSAAA